MENSYDIYIHSHRSVVKEMATNAHNHLAKYAMMKQLPPVMGISCMFISPFYLSLQISYLTFSFFFYFQSITSLHHKLSFTIILYMLPIPMASEDNHFHIFQWHLIGINHSNFHSYSHGIFLLLFFFFIVILIVTSFLLTHYCCRRRSSATTLEAPAASLHSGKLEMGHIMESNISVVGDPNMECCICLNVLKEGGKVKVLPECEHVYHLECVQMWLSANPSCPLCRSSLHRFMSNNNNINNSV